MLKEQKNAVLLIGFRPQSIQYFNIQCIWVIVKNANNPEAMNKPEGISQDKD